MGSNVKKVFGLKTGDEYTKKTAEDVLSGKSKRPFLMRILPFLGPAFIASVAYMDPGNFATNIQGGAKFGYMLIWVIIASNLMAMLLQSLSAKLGIATGLNLAEHCRNEFHPVIVKTMWIVMEVVSMATDLAEFLGAAVGFNLLFGIPLWVAGLITAVLTFLILALQSYGFRPLEAIITALIGVIAACYLLEVFLSPPEWKELLHSIVFPRFQGKESILLATGILGATVMPHVIFLHSSLTQGRIVTRDPVKLRKLYGYEIIDVIIAMGLAGVINACMLVMASSAFFRNGLFDVGTLEEAHRTLAPILGPASGVVFAVSLLASGLSSSSVGTMAGQVIMQGFMKRQIPVWLRRLITIVPSLVVIFMDFDPTRSLIFSQVVLSFGLPFAVIPLIYFTGNKKKMGTLVNGPLTAIFAVCSAILIILLNLFLVVQTIIGS
jgi:manganese transport protein